ncbi:MAG: hypothetical protein ACRD7E_09890, partial [Bryobacteraceae bacterium]
MTAEELYILAKLFEDTHSYDQAALNYRELSALQNADPAEVERGLAGLIRILFSAPEQSIRIGSGDLTFYRDIASMDPYPGALNGILSLLFNSTYPESQFSGQQRAAIPYFHRAKAAELLGILDQRFPSSSLRPALHAGLIEAYSSHGQNDGVIAGATRFLSTFPNAAERTKVALFMADAHARKGQVKEEFAVYVALLKELAAAAGGLPLGAAAPQPSAGNREASADSGAARSPEYASVLDRYIARLVSLKRIRDALALYRNEIARNPNDPGLYSRLAAFLDQNKMTADIEQTYRRAIQQFQDTTWDQKLARWYLRQNQKAKFEALTREIVQTFSGTELEDYFREVVAAGGLDNALYLQVNLYAHERFPHDLVFIRNLLDAYQRRGTADPESWERLIRKYWYYDPDLRSRFFEHLSLAGKLESEIRALNTLNPETDGDRAAVQFAAEAQAWQSRFEEAAPLFQTVSTNYPGDRALGQRTASLHRSLSDTAAAVAVEERLILLEPRNTETLTRGGEAYADEGQLASARPFWNRIAEIEPGMQEGYLESATVFWDYYMFDDALRVIGEGRARLGNPALYAYEAGAIYENQRNYPQAINEYIKGATAAGAASPSRARLLALARRSEFASLVDASTLKQISGPNPTISGFTLRVAVLEAQNRREDLEELLSGLAERSTSFELLSEIEETAVRLGFDQVRQASLERRVALTADPVERIRLRLALARSLESANKSSEAESVVTSVYEENPLILGVVRAAVGFYWRTDRKRRAIETLERSAARANSDLKRQFTLEASNKAVAIADYQLADRLLSPLLARDPLDPALIAARADILGKAGRSQELRNFYAEKLKAIESSSLAASEKTQRASALHRSLIPVLTALEDHAAAIEQYIAVINRSSEDAALVQEAAYYARTHGRAEQLSVFYRKAASDSPRDYRWPMILARLDTAWEDLPAAIEAYGRASAIRPDRTDFLASRGALEERLMRFDAAAATYARLYELAYRDPQWMVKAAEMRARQGRSEDAVKAIRAALIEGRPARSQDYFEAARRLESWNMLAPANDLAAEGLKLLESGEGQSRQDLHFYVQLAARLHAYEPAYEAASRLLPPDAHPSLVWEIANVVNTYYTPEEKGTFAAFLERIQAGQAAQAAGLNDLAARWLARDLLIPPARAKRYGTLPQLIELQQRRMKFAEVSSQIEAYWRSYPPDAGDKDQLLQMAAANYRLAGDSAGELRVLAILHQRNALSGLDADRYSELLRSTAPEQLIALAGGSSPAPIRDSAANSAVADGDAALALQAVQARGKGLPPVWTSAYTALTGYHFGLATPEIDSAFRSALHPVSIGDRISSRLDRAIHLAGDPWFYYGSRYGEYLAITGQPNAEEYLPSVVEGRPASSDAYFTLASYYSRRGDAEKALVEFEHALQFKPDRGDAHIRIAEIRQEQGNTEQARDHVHAALQIYSRMLDQGRLPEAFWTEVESALKLAARPDAHQLLEAYIRRNGSYRVEPLLRAAAGALQDQKQAAERIADLASAATDPAEFLGAAVNQGWLPAGGQEILYERLLDLASARLAETYGAEKEQAEAQLQRWQLQWISALLDANETGRARQELNALSAESRRSLGVQVE